MWRSPEYGSFSHAFKCSSNKPRNWTKILKYEQANETLLWNSERVPAIVNNLNKKSTLATMPAETRAFEYETLAGRKNRFTWTWTPGDPNWKRFDKKTSVTVTDFVGGSSTVVIEGRSFPFVSLLDWSHIQNALKIVDIELSLEFPSKYPGLGDTNDGIPSDEKARQRTAVAIHQSDGGMEGEGLTAVVRRIVCNNREERKMIDHLHLRSHHYIVETFKNKLHHPGSENARMTVGRMKYVPRPEIVETHFSRPTVDKTAVQAMIESRIIREERARSYGAGRLVDKKGIPIYFVGFAKNLTTSAANKYYTPRPKVTGNGPGVGQSWDVFGRTVERALYADDLPRVFENGRWRKLEPREYLRQCQPQQTLLDVPTFRTNMREWSRVLEASNEDLHALADFLTHYGNSALGSWTPAYDRPWQWMGRETPFFVSENIRGEGNFFLGVGDGFSDPAQEGGLIAPFQSRPLSGQLSPAIAALL
jgi:hypothetical protein